MWFGITRCNTKFGNCGTESEWWPLSHVPPHCGKPCPTQNPSVPHAFFSTLLRLPPSFTRIPLLWDEGSVCHKQTTSHQSKRLPPAHLRCPTLSIFDLTKTKHQTCLLLCSADAAKMSLNHFPPNFLKYLTPTGSLSLHPKAILNFSTTRLPRPYCALP